MNLLGIGSQRESVVIKGSDFTQMQNIAEDVKTYIDNLSSINTVSINVQENKPEVHLLFDMETINRNNFTLNNIAAGLGSFGREYSSGGNIQTGYRPV